MSPPLPTIDGLHEECGVFGVFGTPEAAVHTALGLHALQHRGQEATGIVSVDEHGFHAHRGFGHVGDNFDAASGHLDHLSGHAAVGHNRYSTTGGPDIRNIQPIFSHLSFGGFALSHNGNLTNAARLRQSLIQTGSLMQTTTDSEVIVHLVARSHQETPSLRLTDAMKQLEGAWSIVCLTPDSMIAMRDPHGVRPLVLGQLGKAYVVSSETCGLDIIGAQYIRDIEAGEMVIINKDGITSTRPFSPRESRFCIFEYIYFSRPDSVIEGRSVYEVRKNIGRELARTSAVKGDIVVPVPDSGVPAALGFAEEIGLPFDFGIIRNHYVGRTFIRPTDSARQTGVHLKHNANAAIVAGKSVILVDDSIVRGTTSTKIITMMRQAGAREVHMRIASPPITHPCFYGVDTPSKDKLVAANMDTKAIADRIGVDSLEFLSLESLYHATQGTSGHGEAAARYCDACFTGDYPIPISPENIHTLSGRQ